MQQTLTSSMITALLSAICYGIAQGMGQSTLKTVLVWCGVVFGIYAIAGGILVVLDHLTNPLYAMGDVLERLAHPEIALVTAMGNLNRDQLDALLHEVGGDYILTAEPSWKIEGKGGRIVSADKFSAYLYLCENHIPSSELPSVSRNTSKSAVYADEMAILSFLRARKYIRYRSGERFEWCDAHTPKTVRADYFEVA